MGTCENENVQRLHKDSGSTWKNQIFPNIAASPGIGDCAASRLVRILFLKIKKNYKRKHTMIILRTGKTIMPFFL